MKKSRIVKGTDPYKTESNLGEFNSPSFLKRVEESELYMKQLKNMRSADDALTNIMWAFVSVVISLIAITISICSML